MPLNSKLLIPLVMKLVSWNVNGIRAVAQKGLANYLAQENADVVCFQEIKAFPDQLDSSLRNPPGYQAYWNSAEKPGYSGLGVYSRVEPLSVRNGLGVPEIDSEGRVQWLEFADFTLVNTYFPNSQREHTRLPYKLMFCRVLHAELQKLRAQGKSLVLCGDFNVAHRPIDLKNPKANENNAGYLPEERAWMDEFLADGFVDVFRALHPHATDHYTWWSYRPGVREKNIGWRLDYHVTDESLRDRVIQAVHRPEVKGSDHCPVVLELRS